MEEALIFLFGASAVTALGSLGYYLCRPGTTNDVSNQINKPNNHFKLDLDEYDRISEQIFRERAQIVEALDHECEDETLPSIVSYQFFQINHNTIKNQRSRTESKELWDGLSNLIESYPKFNAVRVRAEPDYIKILTCELIEHHAKTKEAAEICLGLIREASNFTVLPELDAS